MNIRFLSSGEKKKLVNELEERFGIAKLPYLLIESGKSRIRGFSGSLSREELVRLSTLVRVEIVGLYLFRKEPFGLRLSVDALHLLKEQITSGIIELNDIEFNVWIRGGNLDYTGEKGVFVIKYKDDFFGCGYATGSKLLNYIPRERQIRSRVSA